MAVEFVRAKSLVRESRRRRGVSLNPYQGCAHDCAYCDGKAEKYGMQADFATRIRAKENAPELLEAYLRKRGFAPVNRERTGTLADYDGDARRDLLERSPERFRINISGGVCDIYQPAEAEVGLSRKVMQTVYDYGFPIFLLTKNKLVLKDIDLLTKINDDAGAAVAMSVTFADDGLRKIFEPGASSIQERFGALKALHVAGIETGIWALPMLPWISDTDENIEGIISGAVEAGVQWIIVDGLTLKPGRQKDSFMRLIAERFPGLADGYLRLYANDNQYGAMDAEAAREMGLRNPWAAGRRIASKYGIRYKSWDD